MVQIIDANTDLVYSPDDEGWYFHRYVGTPVKEYLSKTYRTQAEALSDWRENQIHWKFFR